MRVLRVTPPNPLILSGDDRQAVAAGFCHLLGRLRPEQSLQFYVDARPVRLDELLASARARCRRAPGRRRPASTARATRRRCRAGGCTRRWRSRCAGTPTSRRRSSSAPTSSSRYLPRQRAARATLAQLRRGALARAPLERGLKAHRRAVRESQAHADALRAELEALGLPVTPAQRRAGLRAAVGALQPDQRRRRPPPARGRRRDPRRARRRARPRARRARPRWRCASDRRLEPRLHARPPSRRGRARPRAGDLRAHAPPQQTSMGWLMGAMMTRQPYTLSVHVHALDRRRERQRIKLGYRRLFAINRGAEQRGRVPGLRPLRAGARVRAAAGRDGRPRARQRVRGLRSTSRSARAARARPRRAREAVDYCAEQIESASDCKVNRGEFRQRELWPSTLPLGRDVAAPRRASTRPATPPTRSRSSAPRAARRPGSRSRSPTPAARVERLDPYDPEHANHTLLICGKGGSGKTMTANVILARCDRARRARVRDRPRRPLRAAHPPGRRRAADRARRRRLAATRSTRGTSPTRARSRARRSRSCSRCTR